MASQIALQQQHNPPSTTENAPTSTSPPSSIIPGILFGILTPHIVCTLFLLSRLFSRLILLKKWFWWEDSLILFSFLFSTAVCAVYGITAKGYHASSSITTTTTTTSPTHHDNNFILRTYLALIFYQLSLCLTKLSILSFYLRIFSGCWSTRTLRRLCLFTVAFILCYGIPLLFISIFQCHPLPGLFFNQPTGPGGAIPHCFDFKPLLISSTSLHTATDAWLIFLIIPVVVRLPKSQIPPRQKTMLGVVLSLGVFVIAASLTRLQLSLRTEGYIHGHHPHQASDDEEDEGVKVANTLAFFCMTVLELDVAVICACAPTLRPLLRRLWPRILGDNHHHHHQRQRRRGDDNSTSDSEGGSLDLRSVRVVVHGETTQSSKGRSVTNLYFAGQQPGGGGGGGGGGWSGVMVQQLPPALLISNHRTPHTTTLSLRSFMSSLAPPKSRGRGGGETTAGEGRGLLREDFTTFNMMGEGPGGKRTSSVGFEGYYDQYVGYAVQVGEEQQQTPEKKKKRRSGVRCYSGRWGDSQESFVLGLNDPNSPSRLTPVEGLRRVEIVRDEKA
ncbi:hypothetical protein B0T21DRAFT_428710 [Apiosordaria backusii]|uniref:Rhodopsin domain-containing protein n=1 Tax=Apiosordaria backusii TaxID=314023 RepID=A0AA40ERT0_9PEZI|nr:hypothetical protein B0T21DRAFT_428710 [Apiosordaria backusii]